jgi:hypothetical protein
MQEVLMKPFIIPIYWPLFISAMLPSVCFANPTQLSAAQTAAGKLSKASAQTTVESETPFKKLNAINREAVLDNPLIDFDDILFVGYLFPKVVHMCDQYYPCNLTMGGGLYILKGIKTAEPVLVDVLKDSKVENGPFKGSNLAGGAFLSPDLSYDGTSILFAWSPPTNPCYHIFKVNVDGTNLVQLTDGSSDQTKFLQNSSQNDFDPIWLPDGRIAFISDRRGGYVRGGGVAAKRNYTLHSMNADGSDIIPLSYHEANEWHPSVSNDGMIVYTRWDYIDRDECINQHFWTCFPDGRNPRSYHANYPLPLETFTVPSTGERWPDGRTLRPFAEFNIRAIPGSNKYIATAGPHHGFPFGDLILIDPSIKDDGKMSQIKGITTTRTIWSDAMGKYGTAWPLSEDYYLCTKLVNASTVAKGGSILLLDKSGNEQVVYTSDSWIPVNPIPVKARTKPPAISTNTWEGERKKRSDHKRATIFIADVKQGDIPLPAGVEISALRIIQVFPKETHSINDPRNGYASEALIRMSLGTVPVEADGSVYCEAPVDKLIYFQLLDKNGLAVQSMRSATYVHQGEQMACIGCHEDKWNPHTVSQPIIASSRSPSKLTPDAGGVEPVNFARLVKPVFDKNCTSCHTETGEGPDMSYKSLNKYAFYFNDEGWPYTNGNIISPVKGGSRTTPGKFGASFAPLGTHIDGSHHNAKLTSDEFKRVVLWLDLNSMELGAEYNVEDQKKGKLVWPRMDIDTANPQGIEVGQPCVCGSQTIIANHMHNSFRINKKGSIISLMNGDLKISRVSIYDLSGRCVYKLSFDKEVSSFVLDINKLFLAKGTYIFKTFQPDLRIKINPVRFIID